MLCSPSPSASSSRRGAASTARAAAAIAPSASATGGPCPGSRRAGRSARARASESTCSAQGSSLQPVLDVGDPPAEHEVGRDQRAAALVPEHELAAAVAEGGHDAPRRARGLDVVAGLEHEVGLRPRVVCIAGAGQDRDVAGALRDAREPRQLQPALERHDRVAHDVHRRSQPRGERERAARPLPDLGSEPVVVGVAVGADEQGEPVRGRARRGESVLERVPAGRHRRPAVDEAPAVGVLEQPAVDVGRVLVGQRDDQAPDAVRDRLGRRLVGAALDHAEVPDRSLGPGDCRCGVVRNPRRAPRGAGRAGGTSGSSSPTSATRSTKRTWRGTLKLAIAPLQ